jgi:hypothetical protein
MPDAQRFRGRRRGRRVQGENRERALAAGCHAFDTRPVELPGLLEKLRADLRGKTGGGART